MVKLRVIGEKGHCNYKGPSPFSKLKWNGVKNFKIEKNVKGPMHIGRSIKAFGEWVLQDKPYLNTTEESTRVLRLLSALYKSSKSGKEEQIERL